MYQVWLRNAKMAATKFSFFVISTSDRGDFPRIIVIALFLLVSIWGPVILSLCFLHISLWPPVGSLSYWTSDQVGLRCRMSRVFSLMLYGYTLSSMFTLDIVLSCSPAFSSTSVLVSLLDLDLDLNLSWTFPDYSSFLYLSVHLSFVIAFSISVSISSLLILL